MLVADHLTMAYGAEVDVPVLSDINLEVATGEFLTILGPSGCGKTTLLHLLGGFLNPTSGTITCGGIAVRGPSRQRGMVFQSATLFPWKKIVDNVGWPLVLAGQSKREARLQADRLLELVGLKDWGGAYPRELSGGMKQRAAIARTLIMDPEVLLMDEPFGALDSQTRQTMQEELLRICRQGSLTAVFITHDISEAVFLGDRVIVMGAEPGRILANISIEVPRPRLHSAETHHLLSDYKDQCWKLIHDQ